MTLMRDAALDALDDIQKLKAIFDLTPIGKLEQTVIEAAIEWRRAPSETAAIEPEGDLLKAVDALIAAREKQ